MEADRFFFTEVKNGFDWEFVSILAENKNVMERCGNVRISLNWMENMFF